MFNSGVRKLTLVRLDYLACLAIYFIHGKFEHDNKLEDQLVYYRSCTFSHKTFVQMVTAIDLQPPCTWNLGPQEKYCFMVWKTYDQNFLSHSSIRYIIDLQNDT